MGALEYERSGAGWSLTGENTLRDLIKIVKEMKHNGQPLSKDPLVRPKIAQLYVEVNVSKYLELRDLTHRLRYGRHGSEGVICSLFGFVETSQRILDYAMQLLGPYSQLMKGSKYVIEQGRWPYSFLFSRAMSVAGGTSEIRRNIIAQRVLGLPR